jgi:uncharacterized membrane protein YdbT with pleckstrin-like domain
MGYIENNLTTGEALIFKTRLHWWLIAANTIYAVLLTFFGFSCLTSLATAGVSPNSTRTAANNYAFVVWTCVGVFTILTGIGSLINVTSSEFGVTTRRVIMKSGLIRRKTLELNLAKVESIEVKESLLGRILDFKTVLLIGSGGTRQRFQYVADADLFKRYVVEQMDRHESEPSARPRPRSRTVEKLKNVELPKEDALEFPSERTQQKISQASQYIKQGNRQAATEIVWSLVQSDPQNADVWYLVGYLAKSTDQKKQAYRRALSINPRHTKAREALNALDIDLP